MHFLDFLVLGVYFLVMAGVGIWMMRTVHEQEDYFMGGRSFGKLMQTFAAFGAGTGSSDPVATGRTTFTSGMSGIWSVMYWLFVTPFYWITGVWYRRMRHLTLGDWFVERYESRRLGAAYALFGILFYIYYGSMLFSAIGKVAAPLVGTDEVVIGGQAIGLEYILVPIIGVVVLVYGMLGGLSAAYVTDVIQGICIIVLSVILIPFGMRAVIDRFGSAETSGLMSAFEILHEQLPAEYFEIIGSSNSSEFPLDRIIAVVIINLIGVVVQPHFIATGGGSAKTEMNARVGLVAGNFLKRLCTVGWAITALFAVALFADNSELAADPDRTWGVASRELLGPGLSGLMLACLLAALMSSVDAYMIVGSGLIVRNLYAPFVNDHASERVYVNTARVTGGLVVGGAVAVSLTYMDVFAQLQLTWIIPVLFAAPFWVGMYWRRATTAAAWLTIAFCALVFFILPSILPTIWPGLREIPGLQATNQTVRTTVVRSAAPSDLAKRTAQIQLWDRDEANRKGTRPEPLELGDRLTEVSTTGGNPVFWTGNLVAADDSKELDLVPVGEPQQTESMTIERFRYADGQELRGQGNLRLDFLIYKLLGVDFATKSDARVSTLELPPKIVAPFLVMIGLSLVTRPNSKAALDRYYAKMKTPVLPDAQADQEQLERAYRDPSATESLKLFPGTNLEFQRPSWLDVVGFVACFACCFAIIGLAVWVASLGG